MIQIIKCSFLGQGTHGLLWVTKEKYHLENFFHHNSKVNLTYFVELFVVGTTMDRTEGGMVSKA